MHAAYYLLRFFFVECGGYINGEGIISTPNYLLNSDISDCYWFIDARQNDDTILLVTSNSSFFSSSQEPDAVSRSEVSIDDVYTNNYNDQITTSSSTTMLTPRGDPAPSIIASFYFSILLFQRSKSKFLVKMLTQRYTTGGARRALCCMIAKRLINSGEKIFTRSPTR